MGRTGQTGNRRGQDLILSLGPKQAAGLDFWRPLSLTGAILPATQKACSVPRMTLTASALALDGDPASTVLGGRLFSTHILK